MRKIYFALVVLLFAVGVLFSGSSIVQAKTYKDSAEKRKAVNEQKLAKKKIAKEKRTPRTYEEKKDRQDRLERNKKIATGDVPAFSPEVKSKKIKNESKNILLKEIARLDKEEGVMAGDRKELKKGKKAAKKDQKRISKMSKTKKSR